MRISARLDEDRSRKLELLSRMMQLGISEVLKKAIDALYEQNRQTRTESPAEIMERLGFIGCASVGPDLSERYKEELTKILDAKHGDR